MLLKQIKPPLCVLSTQFGDIKHFISVTYYDRFSRREKKIDKDGKVFHFLPDSIRKCTSDKTF